MSGSARPKTPSSLTCRRMNFNARSTPAVKYAGGAETDVKRTLINKLAKLLADNADFPSVTGAR